MRRADGGGCASGISFRWGGLRKGRWRREGRGCVEGPGGDVEAVAVVGDYDLGVPAVSADAVGVSGFGVPGCGWWGGGGGGVVVCDCGESAFA